MALLHRIGAITDTYKNDARMFRGFLDGLVVNLASGYNSVSLLIPLLKTEQWRVGCTDLWP